MIHLTNCDKLFDEQIIHWVPSESDLLSDSELDRTHKCMYFWSFYTKKHTKSGDYKTICSLIKSNKGICERTSSYVKPYIDYDQKISNEAYNTNKRQYTLYKKKILNKLVEMVQYGMIELNCPVDLEHILCCDSSGSYDKDYYKISFHLIVNSRYRFIDPVQARRLVDIIEQNATQYNFNKDIIKRIDKKPYMARQSLRCIFNSKSQINERSLIPVDHDLNRLDISDKSIHNYLVSYNLVDSELEMIPKNESVIDDVSKHIKLNNNIKRTDNTQFMDQIVLIMVQKKIPTARLISYNNGIYQFQYFHNHSNQCPVGNSTHDELGFYVFIDHNKILARCHSQKCKDKTRYIANLPTAKRKLW
jgi:hypothetical protein